MGIIIFLVGFMLCGFIMYGVFTHVVWKALREEDIHGITLKFDKSIRTPHSYTENYIPVKPITYRNIFKNRNDINTDKPPVYITSEADGIVDIFEEFLDRYDIKIPSADAEEEKERSEEENSAAIYGMAYGDLQDDIEMYLRKMVENINERGYLL